LSVASVGPEKEVIVTLPGNLKVGLIVMPKNFHISKYSKRCRQNGALDPVILLEKGISCPKCFNAVELS